MTLDQFKALIGDLHRPFAVIVASAAGAVATVVVAFKVDGFEGAALFIGAVWGGVAGLYWGRAWENARSRRAEADVDIARATGPDRAAD